MCIRDRGSWPLISGTPTGATWASASPSPRSWRRSTSPACSIWAAAPRRRCASSSCPASSSSSSRPCVPSSRGWRSASLPSAYFGGCCRSTSSPRGCSSGRRASTRTRSTHGYSACPSCMRRSCAGETPGSSRVWPHSSTCSRMSSPAGRCARRATPSCSSSGPRGSSSPGWWRRPSCSASRSARSGCSSASQQEVRDLNERLSRRLSELHSISEITEVIHSTLDFERVGPLVLDILSKVIDVPASALFVIDKDKDETLFSASSGVAPTVARGMPDAYMLGPDGKPDETFACTTILDHKRLMVVFCTPGDRIERMSTEDRLVLQAVSSELVVAVENSQLYKLTKRLSITDELTGLYNYRYLQQRLEDEIERARRYGRSLSLLMLDADDFKKFNDTHGHIAGDRALAEIGGALRLGVREIDVSCRYGGEEFAVLLPETDAEGAFVVAEKVRESVAFHSF